MDDHHDRFEMDLASLNPVIVPAPPEAAEQDILTPRINHLVFTIPGENFVAFTPPGYSLVFEYSQVEVKMSIMNLPVTKNGTSLYFPLNNINPNDITWVSDGSSRVRINLPVEGRVTGSKKHPWLEVTFLFGHEMHGNIDNLKIGIQDGYFKLSWPKDRSSYLEYLNFSGRIIKGHLEELKD